MMLTLLFFDSVENHFIDYVQKNYLLEKKNEEYLHKAKVQTTSLLSLGMGLHLFFV